MQAGTFRWRALLPALFALAVMGGLLLPRWLAQRASGVFSAATQPEGAVSTASAPMDGFGYEKGRWRLAQPQELQQVTLWVSHIVIAHKNSNPSAEYHLRPVNWRPDPPNPDRTEETAKEMALVLAQRLATHPDDFEAAARQSSDDVVTREGGGSLGGVRAMQLPPAYLDASSVLAPGQVSHVLRMPHGYTILKRRAPPADSEVAARRILVRHREGYASPSDDKSERTREEARTLAQTMVSDLKSGARTFDSLLRASDNTSAMPAGDIGVWKLRDPQHLPREIDALEHLRVGEVSAPLETLFGFEILERTKVTPRPRYAMQAIQILIEPLKGAANSPAPNPGELAESIAAELRVHPEAFESMFDKYCCAEAMSWSRGRAPSIGLDAMIENLAIGEIAKTPFRSGWQYYIAKRVDPATVPQEPLPQFELPSPRAAQLAPMIESGEGTFLAQRTREIAKETLAALSLEPDQSAEVSRLFDELARSFEAHPGHDAGLARVASWETTQAAFLKTLGPSQYRRLNDAIDAWTTRTILLGPR